MTPRRYEYEELAELCRRGLYPAAPVRAASGRLNWLMGVSPKALAEIRRAARQEGTGLIVIGSRVSGPRLRQGTLQPALAACLPLKTTRRAASALKPAEEGVEIDKTAIKDFGPADARTSDLSFFIVHPSWDDGERRAAAERLERRFDGLGLGFPVRVFSGLRGARYRDEKHFLEVNGAYLHSLQGAETGFTPGQVAEASRELYMTVNLPGRWLGRADLRNAAATALFSGISFSAAFGWHPIYPAAGFVFGLFGRYLARLRAGAAFRLGDGALGNAAALGVDAGIGAALMAAVVSPAAGLGLALPAIAANSAAHSISRGGLRLWLDKRFSVLDEARQSRGVLISATVTFGQGLVTSYAYAGARVALILQIALAALGLGLLFAPPLKRHLAAK